MSVGWNLNDSITFILTKYILSFSSKMIALPPKCVILAEYTDSAHTEVEDLCSIYMNGSDVYVRCGHDTRLLHPCCTACRRLSISQKRLNRMMLVRDRTIPIILTRGKSKADLAAECAFSLPLMPTWLGIQQNVMALLTTFKKTQLCITIPIKGCSSFMYFKAI